ncbi:toxin-antitoxin system, antitoxin component domain protein [Leptospira weilii serovar Ranarum str. ICFT]|uniref:Toxin-antitoxin system, antitoxin component domain protein n=1 Tax=Leptospira weilii serovar Ranarum str. ICFT TaxID=1218598 RepID=N1WJW0_9LEPT|nr:toxin-antitoxin system, antitoxin component domain protein [Leptospira weilii serovar Ranarum str. ICFT]
MQNPRWKDWLAQAERDFEWAGAFLYDRVFSLRLVSFANKWEKHLSKRSLIFAEPI